MFTELTRRKISFPFKNMNVFATEYQERLKSRINKD